MLSSWFKAETSRAFSDHEIHNYVVWTMLSIVCCAGPWHKVNCRVQSITFTLNFF